MYIELKASEWSMQTEVHHIRAVSKRAVGLVKNQAVDAFYAVVARDC